jgi:hypothetical protein
LLKQQFIILLFGRWLHSVEIIYPIIISRQHLSFVSIM